MNAFFPTNINFTTDSVDYNLLSNTSVRTEIKSIKGWDEDRLTTEIEKGIKEIKFTIFIAGTKVRINNGTYLSLIEDTIYDSGGFLTLPIREIAIQDTGISGILSFTMQ